jgi:hypothetical protein
MLDESNRERKELLHKLLTKEQPEPLIEKSEPPQPIMPQFVPWRVRQQMLEAEDRKKAQLMRDKEVEITASKQSVSKSIEDLEKELGVGEDDASQERETTSVHGSSGVWLNKEERSGT